MCTNLRSNMKHAAAIHFLEKARKRLEATIAADKGTPAELDLLKKAQADLSESISTLESLQWLDQKATEIRTRKK